MKFNNKYIRIRSQVWTLLAISLLTGFMQQGCAPLKPGETSVSYVGEGWARNSINTVIFRKNSLTSKDDRQYIAYYNPEGNVVLGKREHGSSEWTTNTTQYSGNVTDAHNAISIEMDGNGYLHVSWDHHNSSLKYARSVAPGSIELSDTMSMVGTKEDVVSYPEFYRLPEGDLLFLYRDGGSGNGNLIINKYLTTTRSWQRLQDNLIDGEGERNAYWQACVDESGTIHISWVWRESPDVASNHDMCYARSTDGGVSWQRSDGTEYELPITKLSAETIQTIPMNSELINQTSMTVDSENNPFIISYWKPLDSEIPQYQLIYRSENAWQRENLAFRSEPFSLSGMGTKQIPISRPQVLVSDSDRVYVVFRDAERKNRISIAQNEVPFAEEWEITDYTTGGYVSWEPTLDPELWQSKEILSLFLQKNVQVDSEGLSDHQSSEVNVLNLKPE